MDNCDPFSFLLLSVHSYGDIWGSPWHSKSFQKPSCILFGQSLNAFTKQNKEFVLTIYLPAVWIAQFFPVFSVACSGSDQRRIHQYKILYKLSNVNWMEIHLAMEQQWDIKLTKSTKADFESSWYSLPRSYFAKPLLCGFIFHWII